MSIKKDGIVTNIDLADSAEFLSQLIEVQQSTSDGEGEVEESLEESPEMSGKVENSSRGLPGFQRWLTHTRQLGRRASRILEAVDSMHVPCDQRERLADMVRLSLLLECNSAIGFNADGTLRNTEAVAIVTRPDDDWEEDDIEEDPEILRDDAEVLMTKEHVLSSSSGSHGLLVITVLLVAASVVASVIAPDWLKWQAEWTMLVTSTAASLMICVAAFARVGRRHRSIAAYREMGKELQNNRILLSTIRHG